MDRIIQMYTTDFPDSEVQVVYGSSGKFRTQIEQGAPFDLYFSADITYPQMLVDKGLASSAVIPYATGRLVLWSTQYDLTGKPLEYLTTKDFKRIAIANPRHAPYGIRAKQALKSSDIWEQLKTRLVFAESVSHAAHYVKHQHVDAGILALSLVKHPTLVNQSSYQLIDEELHLPLKQGFIITRRAKNKQMAKQFAHYMSTNKAKAILINYGFSLP